MWSALVSIPSVAFLVDLRLQPGRAKKTQVHILDGLSSICEQQPISNNFLLESLPVHLKTAQH